MQVRKSQSPVTQSIVGKYLVEEGSAVPQIHLEP